MLTEYERKHFIEACDKILNKINETDLKKLVLALDQLDYLSDRPKKRSPKRKKESG